MSEQNPKMEGCNIVDCIPQTGECPMKCDQCFYNEGRFYRTLNMPLIPTLEETKGKIVRVNSGHDSNLEVERVLEVTKLFEDKFYNTSIPVLQFGNPTILTINGRDTDKTFYHRGDIEGAQRPHIEIMFVRFRVNTWNIPLCVEAIREWAPIPFVLTDMRYYDKYKVKEPEYYCYKKHILHDEYMLNENGYRKVFKLLMFNNVFWCGNPFTLSVLCRDCRLCEHLYIKTKARLGR